MTGSGGPTIPHALKSDIVQLMLRFSAVRSRWVAQIVEYGITELRLRDLHNQMRTLGRVYAHDDNTLDAFLDSAWKQLLTQSAQDTHLPTREAYCARAFLCMAQAFICGLKSGQAPANPNALDRTPSPARRSGAALARSTRVGHRQPNPRTVRHPAGHRAVAAAGHCGAAGASASPGVLDGTTSACARLCASPQ
jgi:hypothetical protein